MMANGWIFGGIGFVVGLIGGAVGFGSLCTREALKKIEALETQNDEMAEKIEELKAELRKKKETKAEKKEKEMRSYQEYKNLLEENGYSPGDSGEEVDKKDETDDEVSLDPNDIEDVDDPFIISGKDAVKKSIRIISAEEYHKDEPMRQTEALTYYKNDQVLTDITDDRVRGEAGVIGKEALELLNDKDFDEDFLYVANDIEDVMYEIQVNSTGSWYRDILGMEV